MCKRALHDCNSRARLLDDGQMVTGPQLSNNLLAICAKWLETFVAHDAPSRSATIASIWVRSSV